MKLASQLLAATFLFCLPATARADIPPPKDALRLYEITVNAALSRMLLDSTAFQNIKRVEIGGEKYKCEVDQWEWTAPLPVDTYSNQVSSIKCLKQSWCFGKAIPTCTLAFIDADHKPEAFLEVKSATPLD